MPTQGFYNAADDIPLGNNTALNEDIVQRWMAGANTRGTADVLYTCVVTIVLCVWTSVHMNIPAPGDHPSRTVWRKIKWTIYGLLGPEIVLFTAWSQYKQAKDLIQYLNQQRERHGNEKALNQPYKAPFNLRYGFFAVMGGFRVPHPGLEEKTSLISLTPGALKALAYTGRFLWIDDSEVQDRSKADGLAKLLICTQVTWLSVECLARKASNLPLTILEIHTFIHVVCALTIYLIWFKKPLDIKEATVANLTAEDDEVLSLLHLLGMLKQKKTHQILPISDADQKITPRWFKFTTHPNNNATFGRKPMDGTIDLATVMTTKMKLVNGEFHKDPSKRLRPTAYAITGDDATGLKAFAVVPVFPDSSPNRDAYVELEWPKDISPLFRKQAYRAWNRHESDDTDWTEWSIRVGDRADNFEDLHGSTFSIVIQILILMAYGGVHLSAWNSHFPTKIEMWLWRASALLLAGTTPLVFAFAIPGILYLIINEISKTLGKLCRFVFWVLMCILGPAVFAAYVFARFFLVVESFISLRSVPIGVYSAVPWSSYVPHI